MAKNAVCRVCGGVLPPSPLLQFRGMPAMAQFFPDAESAHEDNGADLNIFQCPACGLVQADSRPVHYYREVVRAAAFSPEMGGFRREQLGRFVSRCNLSGKRLVEIGCGRGEYLALLREVGADAIGLEYSAQSVNACRQAGMTALQGYVDSAGYTIPGGPFSGFAIFNFLEHMPAPHIALRGIANNLHPGGIGLVEVPNLDMIIERNLFTEFISDHLFYFTRESLETLLRANGFEVLGCEAVWHNYILSATVRLRQPPDVSCFESAREALTVQMDRFLDSCPGGVAVWGAGHQALAALALLGLRGRVRYVVDSAPFKQNKLTPATHIRIHAPEHLSKEPVEGVLVMAASYSDEVVKMITARHDSSLKIAVLREDGLEVQ